jgi:hypothetical protein
MRGPKIVFDGHTKESIRRRIYEIAEENGYRTRSDFFVECGLLYEWPTINQKDFFWLHLKLVPRHPHYEIKKGCGIENYVFASNTYHKSRTAGRPSARLFAKRTDGTITDISWVQCSGVPSNRESISKVMRSLVAYQAKEFKDACDQICRSCGEWTPLDFIDADHHPKSFREIANAWIDSVGVDEWELKVSGKEDLFVGDRFDSDSLNESWIAFHKANVSFRALCRTCHQRIPTNPSKSHRKATR